jgi:pimeloyl-ACP methyl ester carboxylesterase
MRRLGRILGWSVGAAFIALALLLFGFRVAALWRESAEAQSLAPPGRTIESPLGRIFVQERGPETGQPVLLVPGTAAWGGFWSAVMENLGGSGYRAIAVDMPPFGFSEHRPQADYGRVEQAERLKAVIDGLGLKAPIVVGHSFGAGSVVELAARHGSSLRGIVVVCGALDLPPGDGLHPRPAALLDRILHAEPLMRTVTAAAVTNPLALRPLLATMLHRKEAADERQASILLRPMTRRGTTEAYAQWLPFLLLPERAALTARAPGVAAIRTPTAFIWGERDSVTPLDQGRRLQALVAGSTLEIMPDVGHIPHIEAPAAFMERLKGRLAALGG